MAVKLPEAVAKQGEAAEKIIQDGGASVGKPNEGIKDQGGPKPTNLPDPNEEVKLWKHKYDVLQGMFNAEIPKLQKSAADAEDLKKIIAEQNAAIEGLKKTNVKSPETSKSLDYLRREMPELEDAIVDIVKNTAASIVTEQINPVREQVKSVEEGTRQSESVRFYSELNRLAPTWQAINQTPDFLVWLSAIEGYTGKSRRMLLSEAYNRMDAETAANLFLGYNKEKGIPAGERHLAPPKGEGGEGSYTETGSNPEVITTGFVEQFYKDVALGKYKNDEENARKIEANINKAMLEGRVT